MRLCDWCHQREPFFNGLCHPCAIEVGRKNQAALLHAEFDQHSESCRYCRSPQSLCDVGSKMLANAAALDGRLDQEYAITFGLHDPEAWYRVHGQGASNG